MGRVWPLVPSPTIPSKEKEETMTPSDEGVGRIALCAAPSKGEFPPDPTISVPEAARLLGVGRNAAYEAVARGQIPVIRIGRMLRVPKAALKRMLALDGSSAQHGNGCADERVVDLTDAKGA
jgi:excisionase family DNA binding protein